MLILNPSAPYFPKPFPTPQPFSSRSNHLPPFLAVAAPAHPQFNRRNFTLATQAAQNDGLKDAQNVHDVDAEIYDNDDEELMGFEFGEEDEDGDEDEDFSGRRGEKDFDKDPELAEILGSCLDDPERARTKMEERLRKKRNRVLHTKSGSAIPMKVIFKKFEFSNSYIWFEFYHAPLEKDVTLICDTIRSWHIIGRLGGCNSMNMQLSQSPLDKRPSYDAVRGANTSPTTFYNIGDLEVQDNLARIWVDIGTSEPLLLDVLINALTQISTDYVGIKQMVFGGAEFENWVENFTSEDAGCSVHKI